MITAVIIKRCKICRDKFEPFNSMQGTCFNAKCILQHDQNKKKKKIKKELKDFNVENKNTTTVKMEAQKAFNSYIRMRDYHKPCKSCDRPPQYLPNEFDAGHYVPTGAGLRGNSLRFNLNNCFKQCKHCNNSAGLGGNYIEYRKRLVASHGLDHVLYLENYNEIKPMGKFYYERIKKIFNKKARIQKKRLGIS